LLFYLVDEPFLEGRATTLRTLWAECYRPLPKGSVRTVTALDGTVLGTCGRYYDVWIYLSARGGGSAARDRARDEGRAFWVYDCLPNRRDLAAAQVYAGFVTFGHAYRGNWLWAYVHDAQTTVDDRGRPPRVAPKWGLVLPGPDGPIPTTLWEARREGVDDYRYLLTLRVLGEQLANAGRDDLANQARDVLRGVLRNTPDRYAPVPVRELRRRRQAVADAILRLQDKLRFGNSP
jgi:hypothetical protein